MDSIKVKRSHSLGKDFPGALPHGFKKELRDTLTELQFNPLDHIFAKLAELELAFEKRKDSLNFKEVHDYYKLQITSSQLLLPYVYAKKATQHETKRLEVTADYNQMLEQLNTKAANSLLTLDNINVGALDGEWSNDA